MEMEKVLVGMKDIREWDETFREVFFCEFNNKLRTEIQDYGVLQKLVAKPGEQFIYTVALHSDKETNKPSFTWCPGGVVNAYNCDENEAEWVGGIMKEHYDKYPELWRERGHSGPAPLIEEGKPRGTDIHVVGSWVLSIELPLEGNKTERGVLYHPGKLSGRTWYDVVFVGGKLTGHNSPAFLLGKERPELLMELVKVMGDREEAIAVGVMERECVKRPEIAGNDNIITIGTKTPTEPEIEAPRLVKNKVYERPEIIPKEKRVKKARVFRGTEPDPDKFVKIGNIEYIDENGNEAETKWELYVTRFPTNNWNNAKLISTGDGAAHKGSYFLCFSRVENRLSRTLPAQMLAEHRPALAEKTLELLKEALK